MWEIDPEQKELDLALGFMIRQAATAEFFLHQTVRRLVGGKFASLVTASMQASAVLDAIKRILDAGELGDEAIREMTQIIAKFRSAFEERNKHVHGFRIVGEEGKEVWSSNRRHGGFKREIIEADALMELGSDFSLAAGALTVWTRHHLDGEPRRDRRAERSQEASPEAASDISD
ncbi:hypothetical protein [Streptomyces sp. NPDC059460]|uniref:hypothetical protein n=1 Tax=Streptomyces sp. NPDC059460 TaxID=3346840 RepID=UPI0036BCCCFE